MTQRSHVKGADLQPLGRLRNGPPAAGKSALARRFADEHPPTLDLDVDRVHDLIGGWRREADAAGRMARRIALAAATVHLAGGHDVIVPQYLGRPEFVEQLARVAGEQDARFREVALLEPKASALERFTRRSATSAVPEHREAGQLIQAAGGADELAAMYDRLVDVIAARPATTVVPVSDGDLDAAYLRLLTAVS